MDIDNLTIGEAKKIAALVASVTQASPCSTVKGEHETLPVIVCTEKRAVVFGYTNDATARPITLKEARMCLYWSSDVGGVFGLGERGPTKDCKISATLSSIDLEGVTAVFTCEDSAVKAWLAAKVQGR